MTTTKCGLITIVGRPNVGKSTLLNHLLEQKISITSRKPQTTQHKIVGVLTKGEQQYVFIDTPGFQTRYRNTFNTLLNQTVINSLNAVDVILFVIEAGVFSDADIEVMNLLPKNANIILVVNKQDKVKDKKLLKEFIIKVNAYLPFKQTICTIAKSSFGLGQILTAVAQYLPCSEFLYSADQLTDRSSNFLASELIREKLIRYLGEELPYNLNVEIEKFDEADATLNKISAIITVNKKNQKGIVIGKDGEKLKKISTEARLDMEKLFAKKVFLQIWVKVKAGFADDIKFLENFAK